MMFSCSSQSAMLKTFGAEKNQGCLLFFTVQWVISESSAASVVQQLVNTTYVSGNVT
jgi:hypothetical protein